MTTSCRCATSYLIFKFTGLEKESVSIKKHLSGKWSVFIFSWEMIAFWHERSHSDCFNPLSANPTKWSNTLKQSVELFDHFVGLAPEGLNSTFTRNTLLKAESGI